MSSVIQTQRHRFCRLAAQVRHGTQGIVEAVREIRRADCQCQLDDLPLIEKSLQFREESVTDCSSTSRDAVGMQNYWIVLLIE